MIPEQQTALQANEARLALANQLYERAADDFARDNPGVPIPTPDAVFRVAEERQAELAGVPPEELADEALRISGRMQDYRSAIDESSDYVSRSLAGHEARKHMYVDAGGAVQVGTQIPAARAVAAMRAEIGDQALAAAALPVRIGTHGVDGDTGVLGTEDPIAAMLPTIQANATAVFDNAIGDAVAADVPDEVLESAARCFDAVGAAAESISAGAKNAYGSIAREMDNLNRANATATAECKKVNNDATALSGAERDLANLGLIERLQTSAVAMQEAGGDLNKAASAMGVNVDELKRDMQLADHFVAQVHDRGNSGEMQLNASSVKNFITQMASGTPGFLMSIVQSFCPLAAGRMLGGSLLSTLTLVADAVATQNPVLAMLIPMSTTLIMNYLIARAALYTLDTVLTTTGILTVGVGSALSREVRVRFGNWSALGNRMLKALGREAPYFNETSSVEINRARTAAGRRRGDEGLDELVLHNPATSVITIFGQFHDWMTSTLNGLTGLAALGIVGRVAAPAIWDIVRSKLATVAAGAGTLFGAEAAATTIGAVTAKVVLYWLAASIVSTIGVGGLLFAGWKLSSGASSLVSHVVRRTYRHLRNLGEGALDTLQPLRSDAEEVAGGPRQRLISDIRNLYGDQGGIGKAFKHAVLSRVFSRIADSILMLGVGRVGASAFAYLGGPRLTYGFMADRVVSRGRNMRRETAVTTAEIEATRGYYALTASDYRPGDGQLHTLAAGPTLQGIAVPDSLTDATKEMLANIRGGTISRLVDRFSVFFGGGGAGGGEAVAIRAALLIVGSELVFNGKPLIRAADDGDRMLTGGRDNNNNGGPADADSDEVIKALLDIEIELFYLTGKRDLRQLLDDLMRIPA